MSSKQTPSSPSHASLTSAAAAFILQQQLQNMSVVGGGGGFNTVAAQALLKQQEDQLRATRMLLQQRQFDAVASGSAPSSRSNSLLIRDPVSSLMSLSHSTVAPTTNSQDTLAALACVRRTSVQSVNSATSVSVCEAAARAAAEDESADEDEGDELNDEEYFKNYLAEGVGNNHPDADSDDRANNESFPHKLYRMLYEAEKDGLGAIVSFLPSGRGFTIHKPKDFVAQIMPRFFTTRRIASFQRQLNLYGFRRISEGKEKGAYFHKYLVKGKRSRVQKIKRKSTTARPSPTSFAHRFAATPLQFPTVPSSSSLSIPFGISSTASSLDNATKELLLARYANAVALTAPTTAPPEPSLLEMARLGFLQVNNNNNTAASHQDILRNAAASLLFKNSNPHRHF